MDVSLSNFKSLNNRLPADKLVTSDGTFVASAVNVDITNAGTIRRRKGFSRVIDVEGAHSLWADGGVALFVHGNRLSVISKNNGFSYSDIAFVTPHLLFSYALTPLGVYCSNGREFFRVSADVAFEATMSLPQINPFLNVTADGSLPPGKYQVCVAFRRISDGEESGTSIPTSVTLSAVGGIAISHIPVAAGCETIVFMTKPNGEIFYRVGSTTSAFGSMSAVVISEAAARPIGLLQAPLPAGSIVRYLNGRLFTVVDNTIYYSNPYNYGLYDPMRNYIQFPSPVTMLEPCVNGLYISADKTYWLPGDVSSAELIPVLPYTAVARASAVVRNKNVVWWLSERGIVMGDQNGSVTNVQEDTVAVGRAQIGASIFIEQDGMAQCVSTSFSSQTNSLATRAFIDAEVVRKETVI